MKTEDVNRLIEQAEQSLVKTYAGGKPNYCTPDVDTVNTNQKRVDKTAKGEREWVGLTDEEIQAERHKLDQTAGWTYDHFARAIEAKLKEKNSG